MPVLHALASLKLTPWLLGLLGLASLALVYLDGTPSAWLSVPLLLLASNLAAAVVVNASFRRQLPLLVFHLALTCLVMLAAAGRLSYLKGRAELTEGQTFDGGLTYQEAGPLHRSRLDQVRFTNQGLDIRYMAGPIMDQNLNRVIWRDAAGVEREGDIGPNQPLNLFGYRIYPTSNKGFAPVLLWHPTGGEPLLGALHLPSYPARRDTQFYEWQPRGSEEALFIALATDETLILADRPSRFRLPDNRDLVVRWGDERRQLAPGQRLSLPGGVLEYRELRTWMGYHVFYDWTIPWLLASCGLAIASLGWHFWNKFAARPWNPGASAQDRPETIDGA